MNNKAQFTSGPRIECTPGKWTVQHNNNDDTTHIVANDPHVGMDMVAEIYRVSAYEGNAAIIAAAPAMYLELKEGLVLLEASHHDMVDMYGTDSLQAKTVWERIESTRNTLAQAEGTHV